MVFFTCNACGSSLKKNQVEKHYQNECRNCSVLSCIDCGQDFYGDEYASHTKCISEAEKYQGAMFKGSGNKGDKKQQEWLERARATIQSAKVNPRIASLLEKMSEYSNIPRKKTKFENFIRNSFNVRDQGTLDKVWEIFNAESKPVMAGTNSGASSSDVLAKSCESHPKTESDIKADNDVVETCAADVENGRNQEEKKTYQSHAASEGGSSNAGPEESRRSSKKKKKKSKQTEDHVEEIVAEDLGEAEVDERLKPSRKKKKKMRGEESKQDEYEEGNISVMKKKKKHHLSSKVDGNNSTVGFLEPGMNPAEEEKGSLEIPRTKRKRKVKETVNEYEVEESEIFDTKTSSDICTVEEKKAKKERKKCRDEDEVVQAPILKKPKRTTTEKENLEVGDIKFSTTGGKKKKKKSKKIEEIENGFS